MEKTQSEPTTQYMYEHLAHQIEREDGLVSTRIGWMLTCEGFLFAALAFIDIDASHTFHGALKYILPFVGISVAVPAFFAVLAALSALKDLKMIWDTGRFHGYIRPFGAPRNHKCAAFYGRSLPIVMILAWLYVLGVFLVNDFIT